jgi:hypothetical protein
VTRIAYWFEMDKAGFGELANSPELRAEMRRRAEQAAQWVRASAPVDTGDYRDSVHVVDLGAHQGRRRDRAEVQLHASDPAALWVEVGARGRAGHHLLTRAIDMIERG